MKDQIVNWLLAIADRRGPNFTVKRGETDEVYLERWWVIPRNRWFNIYLHHFIGSDDDRALHDHPWISLSFLLQGSYVEHTILKGGTHQRRRYSAGHVIFRRATHTHRIEIDPGTDAWTCFITGPVIREWGFHCPAGWRHFKLFTDTRDYGKTGRGCD